MHAQHIVKDVRDDKFGTVNICTEAGQDKEPHPTHLGNRCGKHWCRRMGPFTGQGAVFAANWHMLLVVKSPQVTTPHTAWRHNLSPSAAR